MSIFVALVTLVAGTQDSDPTWTFATVEFNHVYDRNGVHLFDQLIAWDESPDGGLRVAGYRVSKSNEHKPVRSGCWYLATWFEDDTLMRIRSRVYRETWTQVDPEVLDRKLHPIRFRRGFLARKK